MDLTYPPEAEGFREQIRAWLEDNLPKGWFEPGFELTGADRDRFNDEWVRKLYDGGWICAAWPAEYGGKGLSTMENVVLAEEFARAKAPMRADFFGDTLVGPSAVLDGEEWVINGQKVWTTQAQYADYCFLLARTDPAAPKHKGISYLLVPMKQPGIEVRPITQPDGTAEFNEVFFDDARSPKENVVGGVNNGWVVANTTLAHERGMSATTSFRRFADELDAMVAAAQANGAIADPTIRQRLMRYHTKIQVLRINGLRSLSATVTGKKDAGVAALGATNKMFWSEMHRDAMELALDIHGADSLLADAGPDGGSWPGTMRATSKGAYRVSPMVSAFFFSRSETIWGGTAEIQRNIVGERVLGLPKDSKPL
jgi:alkylation response protein AidB-like acyl-CoA dehydrogenase